MANNKSISTHKSIALIGMMGTSKTTSGIELAKMLGYEFVDIDSLYEQKFNMTISDTFSTLGEEVFRERESELLQGLKSQKNVVLSCGGGIILREENREVLRDNFFVVQLCASAEVIYNRIKGDKTRPLLKDMSIEKIDSIMQTRKEQYKITANIEISTENKNPQEIVQEIINQSK